MKRILLLVVVSVCGAWLAQLYPLRRPPPVADENVATRGATPQLVRRIAPTVPPAISEPPCLWIEISDVTTGLPIAGTSLRRVSADLVSVSDAGAELVTTLEVTPAATGNRLRCTLPLSTPAQIYRLRVEVLAPGYLSAHTELDLRAFETLSIQLAPAAELSGQIVDEEATPISAATIELRLPYKAQAIWRASDDRVDAEAPEALVVSIVDPATLGWFTFSAVPCAADFELVVMAAGFATRALRFSLARGRNELPPVVLERGARLQVRVQSDRALEIPFEISLKSKNGAWTLFSTATGLPSELVEFQGLPARELRVVAERFLPMENCWELAAGSSAELLAGARSTAIELAIEPASTLEVEVLLPDQSPAVGARVSLRHERDREFRTREHEVDHRGRLRWSGVPDGPVRVIANGPTDDPSAGMFGAASYRDGQVVHEQFAGSSLNTVVITLEAVPLPGPPLERIELIPIVSSAAGQTSGELAWFLVSEERGYVYSELAPAAEAPRLTMERGDLRDRHRLEHVRRGDWYASRWIEVGERGRLELPLSKLGAAGIIEGAVAVGGAPPVGGRVYLFQQGQMWVLTQAIAKAEVNFQDGHFALTELPGSLGPRVLVLHLDGGRIWELATVDGGRLHADVGRIEVEEQ
ncbi:MAG: hypothetical protein ACKVX7_06180 [Planctomycetota bacterium]